MVYYMRRTLNGHIFDHRVLQLTNQNQVSQKASYSKFRPILGGRGASHYVCRLKHYYSRS